MSLVTLCVKVITDNKIKYDNLSDDLRTMINDIRINYNKSNIILRTNRGFLHFQHLIDLFESKKTIVTYNEDYMCFISHGEKHNLSTPWYLRPNRNFRRLNALLIHENIRPRLKFEDHESVLMYKIATIDVIMLFGGICFNCKKQACTEIATELCVKCFKKGLLPSN